MIFRKDPCGIICMGITYSAVFYADYVVIYWVILTSFYDSLWGSLHIILFNTIIGFLTMAHMRSVLSDPGLIPIQKDRLDFSDYHANAIKEKGENNDEDSSWTVCAKCDAYRPPRSFHCRICKRCVRRLDHHCPWINNCVGEWNQKYFIQFLFYVGLLSIYASCLVVYAWTSDCQYCPTDVLEKQSRILHCVLLMLESILFGMFVLAILIDQFSSIFSDETAVEQVKKLGRKSRSRKTKMNLLIEVCGKGNLFIWLMPCHNHRLNREYLPTNTNNDYTV